MNISGLLTNTLRAAQMLSESLTRSFYDLPAMKEKIGYAIAIAQPAKNQAVRRS
jgi:hypothetical protein